jgi:hypothetical protein
MTSLLKFSALAMVFSFSVAYAAGGFEADRKAIGTECKKDAEKIGCKKEMGKGMGKCMFEYKKSHQTWNPSPTCKSALQKLRKDKSANRPNGAANPSAGMPGMPPGPPPAAAMQKRPAAPPPVAAPAPAAPKH